MAIDAAMKTEMQKAYFVSVILIKIELPLKTITICDGAGEVTYKGEVYRGKDEVFGSFAAADPLQEQVGTEAPMMRMKFLPQGTFSMAYITDPANQGTPATIWWGVIERSTGQLIGEPYLVFGGEVDAAEADVDRNETSVTLDIASVWERLFMNGEGMRLNNAQHQHTWAERAAMERGFEYVVAIQRSEPWGYDGPRPSVVSDTIGGQPSVIGGGMTGGSNFNFNGGMIGVIVGAIANEY